MRFASLDSVRRQAGAALRRFPLPLACAWAACAVFDALIVIEGDHRGVLAAGLALTFGIPVLFALALRWERVPNAPAAARALPALVVLLALAVLAVRWPHWTEAVTWRRYAQLSLLAHALVAFVPYLGVRERNGFWQYNRTLLERFVLATLFAGVLMAGLQGALFALKPLFGIAVSPKAYALLATWVAFVFHPWFFMAGVPEDLPSLEARRDYPASVRVFAQFILVPLVAVYQALLTAYLVKVLLTGRWPSGLIGWLVSAEAVAGMLAILLVHPVRERAENLWVRTFARVFHIALLPSLVMLALAIAKRVGQYGVTEDRYFVIALTVWLAAISVFFIARRDGDIRLIPITLAALAVITFGGPWGAYRVSLASQRARLETLLRAHGMLRDGVAVRAAQPLPPPARRELSAMLGYLLGTHGSASVRRLLGPAAAAGDSGFTDPEHASGQVRAQRVVMALGAGYVNPWERSENGTFSWSRPYDEARLAMPLSGFDYHVRVDAARTEFTAAARTLVLACDTTTHRMVLTATVPVAGVRRRGAPPADTLASGSLDSLLTALRAVRAPQSPWPRLTLNGPGARGVLQVTFLAGTETPTFNVMTLMGDLYFTTWAGAPDSATVSRIP